MLAAFCRAVRTYLCQQHFRGSSAEYDSLWCSRICTCCSFGCLSEYVVRRGLLYFGLLLFCKLLWWLAVEKWGKTFLENKIKACMKIATWMPQECHTVWHFCTDYKLWSEIRVCFDLTLVLQGHIWSVSIIYDSVQPAPREFKLVKGVLFSWCVAPEPGCRRNSSTLASDTPVPMCSVASSLAFVTYLPREALNLKSFSPHIVALWPARVWESGEETPPGFST